MKLAFKIVRIVIGSLFLLAGLFGFVLHRAPGHEAWLFLSHSALVVLGLWCLFFVKD